MSEKKRQKFIALIMLASIIWAVTSYDFGDKKATPSEKPKTIQPLDLSLAKPQKRPLSAETVEEYNKKNWGRSPFVSSYSTTEGGTVFTPQSLGWNLSGIIFNSTTPLAVINKRPVTVGEMVDNAEVIAINRDEVIIEYDDKQIKLKVSKG